MVCAVENPTSTKALILSPYLITLHKSLEKSESAEKRQRSEQKIAYMKEVQPKPAAIASVPATPILSMQGNASAVEREIIVPRMALE